MLNSANVVSGQELRPVRAALPFLCALALVCLVLAPPAVSAAEFAPHSYPVPINVDSSFVKTSLYLQFEVKDYNISVEDFAKRTLNPAESTFFKVARAIHDKNVAAVGALWGDPRPKREVPGLSVKMKPITPQQVVTEYAPDFADLQKPKVVSEILIGQSTLFVWETTSEGAPIRLGLEVNAESNTKLLIQDIDSFQDPIANLIVLIMNEALHDPAAYRPVDKPNTKFRYAFPLAGPGNPGKHPVYLLFSGEGMDFPVYNESTPAPTPVLAAYRNVYLNFKNKKYDLFRVMYTPESQTKLKEFIPMLGTRGNEKLAERITQNKYVKFVLNADPVYFIFYAAIPGQGWTPGTLGYDYMYKDPASDKLMLTNFMFQGFLDGIFRDTSLFNQLMLKPATKAPAPKPQQGL